MADLDAKATTLVLRSTSKLTYDGVLLMLSKICQGPFYNYVYLPWPKLAVVNFTSPEVCRAACRIMTILSKMETSGIRYVKQAAIQGLAENLSIFLAKSGYQSMMDPGAPRVFTKNGTPLPLSLAANIYSQAVPVQLQLEPYVSNASERYGTLLSSRVARGVFFL
ncbi:unnamed protein product [Cladocopium goreaui]|uniref:SEC14 cytosolic factor n=1 Tax=Cladocopium goreaui TaxID=2562237 RepID=A0A9P1D9P8_9DINO|nr:unnamed protein product [Cladocopium goreaui]|mmetsp:Transcript_714/g.1552  ORF Transcript_714/g.1552 Transcript_714/m.1552 type:complete len:165 (+) Transcript_714:84-578(+)